MSRRATPPPQDNTLDELRALSVELAAAQQRATELLNRRKDLAERALAVGHRKQDIAAALNVHRTRLWQLLETTRRDAS